MSDNKAVQRFFANALMAVGGLIALLCGGCTTIVLAFTVANVAIGMIVLVVGGLPTAIGVGLFVIGRRMELQADASRPRDPPPLSLDE
jgi:hypothetical protein